MRSALSLFAILAACASRPAESPEAGPLRPLGKNAQGAQEFLRTIDGMVVVLVPAGTYTVGDDRGDPGERPARKKNLDHDVLIDKFEVANEQFARFLNAAGSTKDGQGRPMIDPQIGGLEKVDGSWRASPGREKHPVVAATYWGAEGYARWVGGHIPTSLEWEAAARGPDGRTYPWGEEPPDSLHCNFEPTGLRDTAPVGSFPRGASYFGCMDMAGNVYERVDSGRPGLIKSGCYISSTAFQMRPADQCGYNAESSGSWIGFRTAMLPPR
jgi:formylglycine-generating enzyme required for sulfatase activity